MVCGTPLGASPSFRAPRLTLLYVTFLQAGLNRALLSKRSAESYLSQLVRSGFFHCDPHPGNVAVDAGYPGGRLVYYDFGMMSELPLPLKKGK